MLPKKIGGILKTCSQISNLGKKKKKKRERENEIEINKSFTKT
jgi:hypothetical protein